MCDLKEKEGTVNSLGSNNMHLAYMYATGINGNKA